MNSLIHRQDRIEKRALSSKLRREWREGTPKTRELVMSSTTAVTNIKIINDGHDLLMSVGKTIILFPCR